MKIDIRGLKKIASDGKTTTFQTSKGHKFIVAHKALSPSGEKALSAIPSMYQESDRPDYSNVSASANAPVALAGGGGVGGQTQPMFHGVKSKIADWAGNGNPGLQTELPSEVKGNPLEVSMDRTAEPMSGGDYSRVNAPVESEDISFARGGMVRRYAEGTPDAPVSPDDAAQDRLDSAKKLGIAKYLPAIDAAPVPSNQADASTQGAIGPPSVGNSPAYALPSGMQDLTQGYQTQLGGLQKQQQANQMTAQAQGQLGQEQATTYGAGINQLSNLNNQFQQHYQNIQNERQSLMQEMQSGAAHLDPQAFIKNMSTGGRIMTGIGLVLGGLGAGMTHGPNLAAEFLSRNIDRDIDNQRAQLGVKNNLLNFNFQNSRDLRDAADFTKLNSMDMVSMYLKRQAAQMQNPLNQAAALNTSGEIDKQAGALQNQIAQQRALRDMALRGAPGSEEQFQNENNALRSGMFGKQGEGLAKTREEHHVPNLPGQSSIPVPESAQKDWQEMNNLQKTYQDAQDYMAKVGSTGAWNPSLYGEGQALKERMMTSVRNLENTKRFTPFLADQFRSMVPDLTGTHLTGMDQAKINSGLQELGNQMKTFKQGYGFKPDAQTPQDHAPKISSPNEVERLTKDNKVAVFDAKTKKFLRYK